METTNVITAVTPTVATGNKRKKKERTEEQKMISVYRKVSNRHTLVIELDLGQKDKAHMFGLAEKLRTLGNNLTSVMQKRLDQMFRTKAYRVLQAEYKELAEKLKQYAENRECTEAEELEARRKVVADQMKAMQVKYEITMDDARAYTIRVNKAYFKVHSVFALSVTENVWQGVEQVLYGKAEKLHFRERFDLPGIRAKQINRGIILSLDQDGQLNFSMELKNEHIQFGVLESKVKNDLFLQDELKELTAYLKDSAGRDKQCAGIYADTGMIVDTFRPVYVTIKCQEIRGKMRVYAHITIEGKACPKKKKDGSPRRVYGTGTVGCDIGTQTYAAVGNADVVLDNLAERNGKSTKTTERKVRRLQRKMDRSRRANNPERFNEDGTYKKGSRGPWKESKTYRRDKAKLRDLKRRNRLNRHYAAQEDVWRLREMGDTFVTEPKNAAKLQKKAKAAQTPEEAKDKNGKNKRRKRFGKSIQHRCPGYFQAYAKTVFESTGGHYYEVDNKFRASQYDHKANAYVKKKLSQRWHEFSDQTRIQRDLYSAFLMRCASEDYQAPDREKCEKEFDAFQKMHDALIKSIRDTHKFVCNSGIRFT